MTFRQSMRYLWEIALIMNGAHPAVNEWLADMEARQERRERHLRMFGSLPSVRSHHYTNRNTPEEGASGTAREAPSSKAVEPASAGVQARPKTGRLH